MKLVSTPLPRLRGEIGLPGDKSISHRAIIFNACAHGKARITNFLDGADCRSSANIMSMLGATVTVQSDHPASLIVSGSGWSGLRSPNGKLDAGNSGTTMRLMCGILAGQKFVSSLDGDASLRRRPMGRVINPLTAMGASVTTSDGHAPLKFKGGNLKGMHHRLNIASAQVQTCLLLAGLRATDSSVVTLPSTVRDHTSRMLGYMGASLRVNGLEVGVTPGELNSVDIDVVGDISSAMYWIVAALIHPDAELKLRSVGINPTRSEALKVLVAMGANLVLENETYMSGEPCADIFVRSSTLNGTVVTGDQAPMLIDEIPVLAVAAAMANGDTTFMDVAELRVKESDRIQSICGWLRIAGIECHTWQDGFKVVGKGHLKGGRFDSYGDHRIALSQAVAGLVAEAPITIEGSEIIDVSYPRFQAVLQTLEQNSV